MGNSNYGSHRDMNGPQWSDWRQQDVYVDSPQFQQQHIGYNQPMQAHTGMYYIDDGMGMQGGHFPSQPNMYSHDPTVMMHQGGGAVIGHNQGGLPMMDPSNMIWDEARGGYWIRESVPPGNLPPQAPPGGSMVIQKAEWHDDDPELMIVRKVTRRKKTPQIVEIDESSSSSSDDEETEEVITRPKPRPIIMMPPPPPPVFFVPWQPPPPPVVVPAPPPPAPEPQPPPQPTTFFPRITAPRNQWETQERSTSLANQKKCCSSCH